MKKCLIFKICLLIMITSISNFVLADWVKDGSTWKYEENGIFKTNDWLSVGPDNYYFDETSHMVTGLVKIGQHYYAFHNDGKAYTRKQQFTFNDIEYDIGTKGKVKDLENDLTDEAYKNYLQQKLVEEENNKKFLAEQQSKNESIAKQMEENRKATEALVESVKANQQKIKAIEEESQKARDEYLLSSENEQKIYNAANKGTSSKNIVDNVMIEIKSQLNYRKAEFIQSAKALRASNPAAEIYSYVNDYDTIIKKYRYMVSDILEAADIKYNINDEKMDKYIEQFEDMFEKMNTSFNEELTKQLG